MRRLVSRLLVTAGLAMLGWCAFVVIDASVSQDLARQSLEIVAVSPPAPSTSTHPPALPAAPPIPPPVRGAALASLSIPGVRLSAILLHGSDARTLRRGPGHLENTALPGEPGNVVVAGHRDSFFRPLRNVTVGDDVFLDGPRGHFHYRVASLRVVSAHDLSVVAQTRSATLTLITCYPFWVLGNAPDRFVVQAIRVDQPEAAMAREAAVVAPSPSRDAVVPIARTSTLPATAMGAVVAAHGSLDDSTLIRETISRFRLAYNARVTTHRETPPAWPVTFTGCDMSITGDQALASCRASSFPSSSAGATFTWTFTLQRVGSEWAIRAVVTN